MMYIIHDAKQLVVAFRRCDLSP